MPDQEDLPLQTARPSENSTALPVEALRALRPYQWTKNFLVLAPLLFAGELGEVDQLLRGLLAVGSFCLAASATYLFNDIFDIQDDRAHEQKKMRPLASGALSLPAAWILFVVLLTGSFMLGYSVRPEFVVPLSGYVVLTLMYSVVLKHLVIIDVMVIAIGFVIRVIAGAVAVDVTFSNWLVMCTFFLALFLAISKRHHECASATAGRSVNALYSPEYLERMGLIVASAALLTYTIYTCMPETAQRLGAERMYMTTPFVFYGIARYYFLLHQGRTGGDPSATLLRDPPLLVNMALWVTVCAAIIYS